MSDREPLVIIGGPTGVGKSETAIRLASRIGGEIISADSMQIYRGMDIGTAKVPELERQGIPHHMLDVISPLEPYSAAAFKEDAGQIVSDVIGRGKIPIVVGGTGFYIQALLYDVDFDCESGNDDALRARLTRFADEHGTEALHDRLRQVDPKSAASIHPHNRQRIIRALEYYEHTGSPISAHNENQASKESAYNAAFFVMTDNRASLYERINRRAEAMVRSGLIEETRELIRMGCTPDMTSMQALGYRETAGMLLDGFDENDPEDTAKLADLIALNTRHYAKRQLTWFRREKEAVWLSLEQYSRDTILEEMVRILYERGICS